MLSILSTNVFTVELWYHILRENNLIYYYLLTLMWSILVSRYFSYRHTRCVSRKKPKLTLLSVTNLSVYLSTCLKSVLHYLVKYHWKFYLFWDIFKGQWLQGQRLHWFDWYYVVYHTHTRTKCLSVAVTNTCWTICPILLWYACVIFQILTPKACK